MKVCGYYKVVDDCMCFAEKVRGEKIVHEKIPMEQHLRDLVEAKKRLHDLVTMNCKDFVQHYGH